jgi:IclR family KDG regulon transcriptional repressor
MLVVSDYHRKSGSHLLRPTGMTQKMRDFLVDARRAPSQDRKLALVGRDGEMNGLGRGLEVLEAIVKEGPITVEKLAGYTSLPISTAYRYVRTLRSLGFVEDCDGHYDLGPRTFQMLHDANIDLAMARLAAPVMFDLVARTGETAILTVPDGCMARCIASIEPHRAVRLSYRSGVILPLHAGASAKPLLAHLGLDYLERYGFAPPNELERFTDRTPDWRTLGTQIEEILQTGVCVTHGELDPDVTAIGSPVFWSGRIAASLSIAGPTSRLRQYKVRETTRLVLRAASTISSFLSDPDRPRSSSTSTSIGEERTDELAATMSLNDLGALDSSPRTR